MTSGPSVKSRAAHDPSLPSRYTAHDLLSCHSLMPLSLMPLSQKGTADAPARAHALACPSLMPFSHAPLLPLSHVPLSHTPLSCPSLSCPSLKKGQLTPQLVPMCSCMPFSHALLSCPSLMPLSHAPLSHTLLSCPSLLCPSLKKGQLTRLPLPPLGPRARAEAVRRRSQSSQHAVMRIRQRRV